MYGYVPTSYVPNTQEWILKDEEGGEKKKWNVDVYRKRRQEKTCTGGGAIARSAKEKEEKYPLLGIKRVPRRVYKIFALSNFDGFCKRIPFLYASRASKRMHRVQAPDLDADITLSCKMKDRNR